MLVFRLIIESFSFSVNSLRANKLRTILSLLGITIGIFAIISVFTVIDSLEKYMRESLSSLGTNVVYIQKWPWTPPEGETEYPWWRYLNRPIPKEEEVDDILARSPSTDKAVFFVGFGATVQFENSKADNTTIMISTYELIDLWNLDLAQGRYFTESEMMSTAPLTVIGSDLAAKLFQSANPVGRDIKVNGSRLTIIGVFEQKGKDMFGTSMDERLLVSTGMGSTLVDYRTNDMQQTINLRAKPDVELDQYLAEIEGVMRSLHSLRPVEENDFAMNDLSIISKRFDSFFLVFNIAGAVIGGFSILVGGFGIANIMFVSVKERTRLIGIQKSLGAKRYFILLQFIFESVVLSLIGGLIGLLIVFGGTLAVNAATEMHLVLSVKNVILGLFISGTIGVIAGFVPAWVASRLDPVVAMNAG